MKRLGLSALIILIPVLLRANEKETMLLALGHYEQAWRSKPPCKLTTNPCQTREIFLLQQAAQAADRYLRSPDAKEKKEKHWRSVAQSVIIFSRERSEAYAGYIYLNKHPAAEKAYHSVVDPLEADFVSTLKATLRSDVDSREIADRFGLVDF
jgi:hypothetical protein